MNRAESPEQILIVRHGEKPSPDQPSQGIDEHGNPHEHSLIVRGWQRAGALAQFFCAGGDPTLRCPTRLYSPPCHGKDGDHGRPFETLSPLAAKLGVAVDVRYVLEQEPELVEDVLAKSGVVLVAWEHKRISKIADAIAGKRFAPDWPDDRFDVVWVFDRDESGGYAFRQAPQLLLAGDRAETIATT